MATIFKVMSHIYTQVMGHFSQPTPVLKPSKIQLFPGRLLQDERPEMEGPHLAYATFGRG